MTFHRQFNIIISYHHHIFSVLQAHSLLTALDGPPLCCKCMQCGCGGGYLFCNMKCGCTIGFPIHEFLLVFNSKIWPNSAPLQDLRIQNLSRSLIKIDSTDRLPIYDLLLMIISNTWPNSALYEIWLQKLSHLDFELSQTFECEMWWYHWISHTWIPISV